MGTLLIGQGASRSVSDGIRALGGVGDVAVVPRLGAPSLDAAAVDRIRELPDVTFAVPTFSTGSSIRPAGARERVEEIDVTVTGFELGLGDRLTNLVVDGHMPTDAHDVLVPADLASDLDVRVGDRVSIATPHGARALRVSGLGDPDRLGIFGAENVFADIGSVQSAFEATDEFTRVDLAVAVPVDEWSSQSASSIPAGAVIQRTDALTSALSPVARTIGAVVVICAAVVLLLAGLLAALASDDLWRRRRRTTSTLQAIGATRRWLIATATVEASLASFGTSIVGALLGVASAAAVESLSAAPTVGIALAGVALGTTVAAVSAVLSGLRSTVGGRESRSSRGHHRTVLVAVAAGAATVAVVVCTARGPDPVLSGAALALSFVTAVLVAPLLTMGVAPLLARVHWTARGLVTSAEFASRSSAAALTAVVMCFGIALGSLASGVTHTTSTQIERQFGADVQVTGTTSFPRDVVHRVAGVRGVDTVATSSVGTVRITTDGGSTDANALAVDRRWTKVEDLAWSVGEPDVARRDLADGIGVALPDSLAERLRVEPGDVVELSADGATLRKRVSGTFTSLMTGDQIVIDLRSGTSLGFGGATGLDISVDAGADPVAVRDRIDRVLRNVPGAIVVTAADMRARAAQQTIAAFSGVFALVLIAVALGTIGAAGAYARVVDRRRRELGTLRAVGATSSSLRLVTRWEAVVALCSGMVPGVLCGVVASRSVSVVLGEVLGVRVATPVDGAVVLGVVVVASVGLWIACAAPARRAGRVRPSIVLSQES